MAIPLHVKDCLLLLKSLQTLKEQFSQTDQFWFKRLCERTEIFLVALKYPEIETVVSIKNETELAVSKNTLESLKKLLSDIHNFVSKDNHNNSFSITQKMIVSEEFRLNRAKAIFLFYGRIHELRSELLPALDVSIDKIREKDLEDFQLDMEAMLGAVMKELDSLRMNTTAELKRCLQAMKQDCSERQTNILNKLLEVESKIVENHLITLIDLAGIEEALHNQLSEFMAFLKSKNAG
jgi:hypothetical protein